ncbi:MULTISPECIES: type II toxin-antitoxin system RelB/DinJ family antitoxin [Buttiauxella]|jgi:DNA-damage-inducible protein J|uniref:type II toxin-antitoxin system RelB/DinJ family antitoxin n=1 Tax=Buttiauxella TaxID=82976 RepID=UPI000EF77081|nr:MULTISPECIES: type II toxin-antitoxin system RelB/DinJ family antitoxin [Buttiauxella]AYN27797.1 type II toxin-antitoxin system RelB/DinJ family antitoxin [Buttiauxella sp. 3AFRM03]MCE0828278.1 type II toxin-antitoxin system RelB/DinJ family antitoxin [Buttiauxella ferragutiae]TDN50137.1 DNA-damage-inducible protein J [Buttiauxella sp. JUb87]UNK60927.1 type II toxin-antitoxin system RelB/DinJ family antitoxin [Buttiauxella ferragutiae]
MDSVIRTRIDSQTKQKATEILESCGLTMSTALRLFVEQVVINEGLPFDINRKPSPRLIQAMRETQEILQNGKSGFSDVNEQMDALNNGQQQTGEAAVSDKTHKII